MKQLLHENEEVSEKFNSFFQNAVESLKIQENKYLSDTNGINDPIHISLKKYVLKINEIVSNSTFSLKEIALADVVQELKNLNSKNANTFNNIPPKILKEHSDICKNTILRIINNGIRTSQFPNELKLADVTPIFKTGDSTDAKNYRPI